MNIEKTICSVTGAKSCEKVEEVQSLWGGYGEIVRFKLFDSSRPSVIVKHIKLPKPSGHPRGWNTDRSHQRKLKSYEVEVAWYKNYNSRCGENCNTPRCLDVEYADDEILIIMEDLDSSGFGKRVMGAESYHLKACLEWLADFHAEFMGVSPKELWESGTYWHLQTRPDELDVLDDKPLKAAAQNLDNKLTNSVFQTFVHGDAKLANFCFSEDGRSVSAVDFQYVGGGCGMKDVAYFIGSCLYEEECESQEVELLDIYFTALVESLKNRGKEDVAKEIENEWRPLYRVAWADFHRFVKGWSPGHWKIHSYSERVTREVLESL
jgi:hypothetical protein